ncbi:MAG: hypothetical protein CL868_16140 [Cytophagaceae bacterium]|nr:hypothetical protein [Cytophagaceae bacterium]|tara:strand:+ start:273 stop:1277 length:1005 start_codon:yes stop_codon:yes gene_type:complete
MNFRILVLILFFPFLALSQRTLQGKVTTSQGEPLPDASVYFDGTTIGTITVEDGSFSIEMPADTSISLVISMLGYETIYVNGYAQANKKITVQLRESTEQLDAVILEEDTWSRAKKLSEFKRIFLGANPPARECTILNEDALKLIYIPSKELLTAYAEEPLIIENRFLGYRLRYTLTDFTAQYNTPLGGLQQSGLTYYAGLSFFEELKEKPRRKQLKNRELAYLGSTFHFLKSLRSKSLTQNGFKVFADRKEVPPYTFINVFDYNGEKGVTFKGDDPLIIMYDNNLQTSMLVRDTLTIDKFGNHTPPDALTVGGNMGARKIAFLLPLDYQSTDD